MSSGIFGLIIPKYGMVMTEGRVSAWRVDIGDTVTVGDELVDIETEKVANVYESPHSGILRRKLVPEGQPAPIGSLFAVISAPGVPDAEIDTFVEQLRATLSSSAAASSSGPTAEVVDIQGRYIRYLKKGEGPEKPIVLIHGFGGDLNNWILNQDTLADSHAVYAVDLPGHGGSEKSPAVSAIDDLAAAIVGFLDAKGISGAHLVGHSLGGGIAIKTALLRPELVASLTLLAPIGLGKDINSTFIQGLVEADRRKEMQAVLEKLFHDPGLVSRDMTMNVLKGKRIDGAVECLRAIAQQFFPGNTQAVQLRDELVKLPMPVQIVWGLDDQIIPSQHAANFPKALNVHVIENAGHMVHMEKATAVNKLIQQFIDAA